MKNELKISVLSIMCVLGLSISGAYAASSVRALGGSGTYVSASSAANSGSSDNATSVSRSGSVRVSPTTTQTTTSSSSESASGTRVVNVPRLSIGQYLGGGTSVSGGSSLRPQTPGSGSASGGSDIDPGLMTSLQRDVDELQRNFIDLSDKSDVLTEALNEKQDILLPDSEGFINIDQNTNEIYLDVEHLKNSINDIVGDVGREIEIGHDGNVLRWRYVDDTSWNTIISFADLANYGNYALSDDLVGFIKSDDMDLAIANAINEAAKNYATKLDLESKADKTDLDLKANISDVYTKTETLNKQEIAAAIAEAVTDGTVDLTGYAKTDYVDSQLDSYIQKGQVTNDEIASTAAIDKTKLAETVQQSLDKADAAVSMDGAGANMVLGTDENGDKVWYEIVDIKE